MKAMYLGLAMHNHQPIGNFPWVFDDVFEKAYLPMLELLERHPTVRLSLHYSGPLLDYFTDKHPDFLDRVAALVKRGQVEVISGGYYEPILPIIPDADKLGQISKLTQRIKEQFGQQPAGLWLAERVWEPYLPMPLTQAGMEWTIVDDTHFKLVGLDDKDLLGYYLTEEQGHTVKIFPSSKVLRYLIPWKSVQEVIAYLRQEAGPNRIAIMGDDGEKFGSWPETYMHCWENQWMENFFKALEENSSWLKTITLGEWARNFPALGLVYLPAASYFEMMEWSLPTHARSEISHLTEEMKKAGRENDLRFIQSGFWRGFLSKYPESNNMQKKMLRVHNKVHALTGQNRNAALDNLWKSQSNCPYWHGVFGGLYLPHLRRANYNHMLEAEVEADGKLLPGSQVTWELSDMDVDGYEELLVESTAQDLYFDLEQGGTLFEWDLKRYRHNLVDTLSRRPEAYHQTLIEAERHRKDNPGSEGVKTIHEIVRSKEEGLDRFLNYDWYRKCCLIDHILSADATLDAFSRVKYGELGDFVNQPYEAQVEVDGDAHIIKLQRHGNMWMNDAFIPLIVEKQIRFVADRQRIWVKYTLTNPGDRELAARFGTEWNLSLIPAFWEQGNHWSGTGSAKFNEQGQVDNVTNIAFNDTELGFRLDISCTPAAFLWYHPVETVSSSEDGFERVFQAGCLLLHWKVDLKPGQTWSTGLDWEFTPI